jgi:hypothetical protein
VGPKGELLEYIEDMTEKNTQLKSMLSAGQSIDLFIKERDEGKAGDPNRIIETLQSENKTLEEVLMAKEARIQAMSADPANRQLMMALSRLQREYRELLKEKEYVEALYEQEKLEKQAFLAQTRERAALEKEIRQLKTQLETSKQLGRLLKKSELRCQILKKERSESDLKYQRAMVELESARNKLTKMNAEYNHLMAEYRKLFDE